EARAVHLSPPDLSGHHQPEPSPVRLEGGCSTQTPNTYRPHDEYVNKKVGRSRDAPRLGRRLELALGERLQLGAQVLGTGLGDGVLALAGRFGGNGDRRRSAVGACRHGPCDVRDGTHSGDYEGEASGHVGPPSGWT